MKKWITLLLTLTLMFVFIGCGGDTPDGPDVPDEPDKPTEILPTSVTIRGMKETIKVGDYLKLEVSVAPAGTTNQNVIWKSSDDTVLKVDSTGGVTAIAAGTAKITITSRADSKIKDEVSITVIADEVDLVSIKINGKATVEPGKTISLTATALPEGAKSDYTWASSDTAIATIDENGVVTGVAEGTVTLTATSKEFPTIKGEYTIIVKKAEETNPDGDTTKPTSITVEYSETQVFQGKTLKFNATVYPEGTNQNVNWYSRKEEVATVSDKGVVTGVTPGITYIWCTSAVDETIASTYVKVTVKEYVEVVKTYPDLQGYRIQMMYHNTFDPYSEKYTGSDKAYKQAAIDEIKRLYNVEFDFITFGEDASWGPNRVAWINSQAESGTAPADFYDVTVGWIKQLVDGGALVDLTQYYQKWGEGSMSLTEKLSTTVRGKLYGISTAGGQYDVNVDIGMFYNYGMLKKYNLVSPAQLFNEGKWNYTDFTNWVKSAQAVLPEGTFVLSGHPYYYWFGMINAGGIKLTDTASTKVNIKHAYARQAANVLRNLYTEGAYETVPTWAESDGAFIEGKSLISSGSLWFVRHSARWTTTAWGEGSTEYGYVPFPWPDNKTKEETRISTGGDTGYVMAERVRPAYVDNETLYQVLQDYFLLTVKNQEADPVFDGEATLVQYAESRFDDPESVTAFLYMNEIEKLMFDPGHAFYDSTSGSPMTSNLLNIVSQGGDFDQVMDEDYDSYMARFLAYYA